MLHASDVRVRHNVVEVVVPVRVCYLLCAFLQFGCLIGETIGNNIGDEGARYIGDGIKACTGLTTLNLQGTQSVSCVQIVDVACCMEMSLLLCAL